MTNIALWPLVVYFMVVLALVGGVMVGGSYLLGERHRERATVEPYESGIISTGSARRRFDVKFYLIAVFFVIFDVEAMFIFAWAVGLREAGWTGFIVASIFIGVLLVALAYVWRLGALDLRPEQHKRRRA